MPFDPNKPANNAPNSSAEMRAQLTALYSEIQQRPTVGDVSVALVNGSSNISNNVTTLDAPYGGQEVEELRQKLNELILALRR